MATLIRQRVILHQREQGDYPGRVLFRERLDEPGVERGIAIATADWRAMGSPDVVTVTIEPGDRLNDDEG